MEYLDIYDENGNHLGKEERGVVHKNALWHKTVHCWLYDSEGNVYFQIRTDDGRLYTTASGHIQAGETLEEGFAREIFEEIGYAVDANKTTKIEELKFVLDRQNKDGSWFRDRAIANIFASEFDDDIKKFCFDPSELLGLVKVDAKQALNLMKSERGTISGTKIEFDGSQNIQKEIIVDFCDFLVNNGETALKKYGKVLVEIINLTK